MRKDYGFTIVELIVAVLIVVILISIAIPSYVRQMEIARCSFAIKTLMTLRRAELLYYSEYDTFFINTAQINAEVGGELFAPGNPDWTFAITTAAASQLQLRATRLKGPQAALGKTTITLTDDPASNTTQQWGGTYPKDNPGNW